LVLLKAAKSSSEDSAESCDSLDDSDNDSRPLPAPKGAKKVIKQRKKRIAVQKFQKWNL